MLLDFPVRVSLPTLELEGEGSSEDEQLQQPPRWGLGGILGGISKALETQSALIQCPYPYNFTLDKASPNVFNGTLPTVGDNIPVFNAPVHDAPYLWLHTGEKGAFTWKCNGVRGLSHLQRDLFSRSSWENGQVLTAVSYTAQGINIQGLVYCSGNTAPNLSSTVWPSTCIPSRNYSPVPPSSSPAPRT